MKIYFKHWIFSDQSRKERKIQNKKEFSANIFHWIFFIKNSKKMSKKCCFCFDLGFGAVVIAVLYSIISIFSIVQFGAEAHQDQFKTIRELIGISHIFHEFSSIFLYDFPLQFCVNFPRFFIIKNNFLGILKRKIQWKFPLKIHKLRAHP